MIWLFTEWKRDGRDSIRKGGDALMIWLFTEWKRWTWQHPQGRRFLDDLVVYRVKEMDVRASPREAILGWFGCLPSEREMDVTTSAREAMLGWFGCLPSEWEMDVTASARKAILGWFGS
jgi:hypothetical protein